MDYGTVLDEAFLVRLRRVLRRATRNEHDVEDVVQDALVKLLRKGGDVPPSSLRAWLFTVARREAVDRARRNRRVDPLTNDPQVPATAEPSAIAGLAGCMGPMLDALPQEQRDLLQRVDVRGESQSEIARAGSVPLSTVKSRVQRARARLRSRLEDCCTIERDHRGEPVSHRLRSGGSCDCPAR